MKKNRNYAPFILLLVILGLAIMLGSSFFYRVQHPSLVQHLQRAPASGPAQQAPEGTGGSAADNMNNITALMGQLQENPENVNALFALADAFMQQGDFSRALPFLERAEKIDAQDIRALYLQGICLFQMKEPARAAVAFEKSLSIEEEPSAQFNLAILYRRHLDQFEKGTALLDVIINNPAVDAELKKQAQLERTKMPEAK